MLGMAMTFQILYKTLIHEVLDKMDFIKMKNMQKVSRELEDKPTDWEKTFAENTAQRKDHYPNDTKNS